MSVDRTMPDDRPKRRLRLVLRFAALLIVLGAHAWIRSDEAQHVGYDARHFYSRDYHVALAIMMGRGFEFLRLDTPEGRPLREFTLMERGRLDAADLAAFDAADRVRPPETDTRQARKRRNEFSRVLELYVAAGLWSIFGIDWSVHTAFYVGVSTLCGLLVFLATRRLSGSFWCGLLAAALFALSPYETRYAILSVRDSNPLWFTIIAYWSVTCVADRFRSAWANGLSYFATGAAATLGLGWRPDASMLLPVTLVTLIAALIWNRRRWRWIGLAVLLFLAGAVTPMRIIAGLLPDDAPPRGTFQFLHVSYYADDTRSNILEREDSFQTLRDDSLVHTLALEFHEHDPVEVREEWDESLWGPAYSNLMVRLFHDMWRYHVYDWMLAIPGVYVDALIDAANPQGRHFAKFEWWLPWAAILGGVGGLWIHRRRAPILLSLLTFTMFYACVYLVVLPEEKHLAPFLCPLTILGAIGLWLPVRILTPRPAEADFEPPFRIRRVWAVPAAVAVVVVVTASLFAAHHIAFAQRQEYLAAIRVSESSAADAVERIADRRVFATTVDYASDEQRGYVLDIVAGDRPGALIFRVIPDEVAPPFETRHALVPGSRQRFFFSCYRGWLPYGNHRSLYAVRLTGDAEIVAAQELDLGAWHRLPFATVFTADDAHAGSPRLPSGPAVRFLDRAAEWNRWGLSYAETLTTALGPPSRLVAGRDDPSGHAEAVAESTSRVDAEGTWIRTGPHPGHYTAQFGAFTAPERGRYLFRMEARITRGDFLFGLLSGDQSHWMPLAGTIDDVDSGGEVRILLCDLEAGESVIPTLSNPMDGGNAEYLIRGLEIRRLEDE